MCEFLLKTLSAIKRFIVNLTPLDGVKEKKHHKHKYMLPRFTTHPQVLTAVPRRRETSPLVFRPLRERDIDTIRPYLNSSLTRTCDYTVGGIVMWAEYFDYSYCIYRDTLFIKGVTEDDVTRQAYSLPVGKLSLEESVELLRHYCREAHDLPLTFSAVPEEYIAPLELIGAASVELLDDWGDYLYDAQALATLSGKKLGKKRNHVNRFMAENPDYRFELLTQANLPAVREFFKASHLPLSKPAIADVERDQVMRVLDHMDRYPFSGAVLSTPQHGIVAFTLGEVVGDTLFVHIEKMNHEVVGAGETINKLFAELTLGHRPEVRYINREEDVGDPGLRHAKESYHPLAVLKKYNVVML